MLHQLVLNYLSAKTNFVFNRTLYTPLRERYAVWYPQTSLKTLLKELFTNKGEILSCKSVTPWKNRKNSRAYYVRTRDKSGSNSPPFQRNVQIRPSPGMMHSQMPGVCPGGMLKFRIDRRITERSFYFFSFVHGRVFSIKHRIPDVYSGVSTVLADHIFFVLRVEVDTAI